ncbi:hypothetical protein BH11MYX3_BH11MYX3_09550 [soil metagenome]
MRARDLMLIAALCGCVSNPDPRQPSIQKMEREGLGGYIVVTTRQGEIVQGELISVESQVVRVLRLGRQQSLVIVPLTDVRTAELYHYESEGGLGVWAALGTLSTISHGFFLVLSAPAWILTGSLAAGIESRHVINEYPDDDWPVFAKWARFPQGMPLGLDEEALLRPRAQRTTQPVAPPPVLTNEQLHQQAKQQAWALTQKAQAAARADDCGAVLVLSGQVQGIDADFYDTTFVTDAGIRRCLQLAPLPPSP